MNVEFDHDFQQKVMSQIFATNSGLKTVEDVNAWRNLWMKELKSWHSPYKVLIDVSGLNMNDDPTVKKSIERMILFFEGMFLRKVVGYGYSPERNHDQLPFEVYPTLTEASKSIGIRAKKERKPGDFRSNILIENNFREHFIEISFIDPAIISSMEHVDIFKQKMLNNLMQWHSKWNMLIDCSKLTIDKSMHEGFDLAVKVLQGFFMKSIMGINPLEAKENYPFPVYRSRHRAVAQLEKGGSASGDDANCQSRKVVKA